MTHNTNTPIDIVERLYGKDPGTGSVKEIVKYLKSKGYTGLAALIQGSATEPSKPTESVANTELDESKPQRPHRDIDVWLEKWEQYYTDHPNEIIYAHTLLTVVKALKSQAGRDK